MNALLSDMHECQVCFRLVEEHRTDCDACAEGHWPALCCPGCPCGSYEEAHGGGGVGVAAGGGK